MYICKSHDCRPAMRYAGISFTESSMDNAVCKTFKKSKACK